MNTIKNLSTNLTCSDWFCGAGGSSEGAKFAGVEIAVAANHWKLAIETHNTNHPDTDHYHTNLVQADPRYFPTTNILWASPECTNHSLAKGRKRKNAAQISMFDAKKEDPEEVRSRATMWCVPRFAEYHSYDLIVVENVVDVRHWVTWDAWLMAMDLLGYNYQTCYFNSMFFNPVNGLSDYPPQSRDRIYVVFWKKGNRRPDLDFRPLAWCSRCGRNIEAVQSWKNPKKKWGRYGKNGQYLYRCPGCTEVVEPYYYAAWNAIDWRIDAPRIGDRKTPLKENTLRRIRIGLEKYGRQPLVIQTDRSHALNNRSFSLTAPIPTQTTRQNLAFLVGIYGPQGQKKPVSLDGPVPTLSTTPTFGLVVRMKGDVENSARGVDEPLPTLTTVGAPYILEMHAGNNARPIDDPLHCVLAGGNHHGLVMPQPFTVEMYGKSQVKGVDEPLSCVLGNVHHGLVMPQPFAVHYYTRDDAHSSIAEALPTLPTENRVGLVMPQPFLSAYYGGSEVIKGMGDPSPTVSTVDRLSLAVPQEELRIEDCGFRMLQPHEIKDAMGFREDYVLLGTNREKVKLAGNAVTPPVAEWIYKRCAETFE